MQFHAAHTQNICLDWIRSRRHTPLSENMGAHFLEHGEHLNPYWGRESQLVKQPASHLGWLSGTPGIGEESLMAPELAETQTPLSTAARYLRGEVSQRWEARIQQLFCPTLPRANAAGWSRIHFLFKSFLYCSIFFFYPSVRRPQVFCLVGCFLVCLFIWGTRILNRVS